jgi:hypothetical protein
MKLKAAVLSALVVLSASASAAAGPIAEAGQRAEALQAEGKTLEALQALDAAVEAIWTQSPLLFRNVTLVGEDGTDEPADRTYRPDERLRIRVEPVGYGFGGSGPQAQIGFTGDLAIENQTGQVLGETRDLFEVSVDSPRGNRHFEMTIGFVVPYIRPGDYIARFTVRDQNSAKTGSFDVPFTVGLPAAVDGSPAGGAADPGETPAAD